MVDPVTVACGLRLAAPHKHSLSDPLENPSGGFLSPGCPVKHRNKCHLINRAPPPSLPKSYFLGLGACQAVPSVSLRMIRLKNSLDCCFVTGWIEQRFVLVASPETDQVDYKGS